MSKPIISAITSITGEPAHKPVVCLDVSSLLRILPQLFILATDSVRASLDFIFVAVFIFVLLLLTLLVLLLTLAWRRIEV